MHKNQRIHLVKGALLCYTTFCYPITQECADASVRRMGGEPL